MCRFSLQVVKYSWQEAASYRLSGDLDEGNEKRYSPSMERTALKERVIRTA